MKSIKKAKKMGLFQANITRTQQIELVIKADSLDEFKKKLETNDHLPMIVNTTVVSSKDVMSEKQPDDKG